MNRHRRLARYIASIGALVGALLAYPIAFDQHGWRLKANAAFAQDGDGGSKAAMPQSLAQNMSGQSIDRVITDVISGKAAPGETPGQNEDVNDVITRLIGEKAAHEEEEKATHEQAVAPNESVDDVISRAADQQKEREQANQQKEHPQKAHKKTTRHYAADEKSRPPAALRATTRHILHDRKANSPPAPASVRDRASDSDNALERENGNDQELSSGPGSAGFDISSGAASDATAGALGGQANADAGTPGPPAVGARPAADREQGALASMIAPYVPAWLRQLPASYAFASLFGIGLIIALLAGAIHSRREELD